MNKSSPVDVGRVLQLGIAGEDRGLDGELVGGLQIGDDGVGGALLLVLVELRRREGGDAVQVEAQGRLQAGRVGDLELVLRGPGDQRDAAGVVEDVVEVAEGLVLVGVVVDRGAAAVRALDADVGAGVAAGEEGAVGAGRAAVLDRGLDHPVAAAVDTHLAGVVEAALGGDVDDAGVADAVLRGQGAGDQVDIGGEARRQRLAEHLQALGQDDVVQAELDVAVVAADVQLAEAVLRHARRLQDHLIELRIGAGRQVVDERLGHGIAGGAQRGLDLGPRRVQPRGGDHDLGDLAGRCGRRWGGAGLLRGPRLSGHGAGGGGQGASARSRQQKLSVGHDDPVGRPWPAARVRGWT
ncbi:hypothetical protein [Phenylobacterium sp.]|uniref:hypothetical protein n=1 Tax=Phenylobacterium sp. TaxID=1871053 RepID=UPI0025DAD202|nr:hypothetical protein [Phenylobacterium sp.]